MTYVYTQYLWKIIYHEQYNNIYAGQIWLIILFYAMLQCNVAYPMCRVDNY